MDIEAVCFDIGHTLIKYNNPLNWKELFSPALKEVIDKCDLKYSEKRIIDGIKILTKYNTWL